MFKDKKYSILWIVELILPWLVLVFGIPAGMVFSTDRDELFRIFYGLAMGGGVVILVIEAAVGLAGFVWMTVNICRKKKEPFSIERPLMLWICSFGFIICTLLLMLFVQGITYGQGV